MLAPDTLVQNRYLIVRLIGQGGMGAVYQAVDRRLGNTVALKQTLISGAQFSRAFEREAQLLAGLRHPALPRVIDHFADEAGQFLVMEFIPGNDLAMMLAARGGPFPLEDILRWSDQVLDALDYLHTQQPPIIHRDIKPQNMKVMPRGEIILLDFGLAKGSASQSSASTTGSLFGYTPQYAPLEQIQGIGTDPRSDLYALAATMHYLLTYAAPVNALTRAAAVLAHQPDPMRPARELRPNIPAAVDAVLNQALALDIGERPASAAVMRAALTAALDMTRQATAPQPIPAQQIANEGRLPAGPAVTQPHASGAPRVGTPGRVRSRALAAAGGIAALLAVAAVALFINRPGAGRMPAASSAPTPAAPVATQPPIATAALVGAAPTAPPPEGAGLQVGQAALTRGMRPRTLWTDPAGGVRVNERPRLLGGAQVTILAIESQAVQVRTAEGVEGWIHEPADTALTTDLTRIGIQRRFNPGAEVRVVWSRGIPIRDAPRSTANKLLDQLKAGQGGAVREVLGDWLKLEFENGSTGWARWYYDGEIYVDLADAQPPPAFTRRLLVQSPRLTGDDVRAIQRRLNDLAYLPDDADGIYGPNTEDAIKSFQTNNRLDADGIVGPQTWERLFRADAVPYEDE